MSATHLSLLERIARVLAAAEASANAEGDQQSAGATVDLTWPDHRNQALAVLHAMREPDPAMTAAGDAATWRKMVEAAISESR